MLSALLRMEIPEELSLSVLHCGSLQVAECAVSLMKLVSLDIDVAMLDCSTSCVIVSASCFKWYMYV